MSSEDIRPRGFLFSEYVDTKNQNLVLETRTNKHDDSHDSKQ